MKKKAKETSQKIIKKKSKVSVKTATKTATKTTTKKVTVKVARKATKKSAKKPAKKITKKLTKTKAKKVSASGSISTKNNPLLQPSTYFDGAVPFNEIKNEHYIPALKEAIKMAQANLKKLKTNKEKPTFENTIVALEVACEDADYVGTVYGNLESANGDAKFMALGKQIYPMLSNLKSDLSLDPDIFKRVKAVYENRNDLGLNPEQKRLLENTYKSFVRNGALLSKSDKERVRKIDQQLAVLGPAFAENVLNSTNAFELIIHDKNELEGLPESALEAAAHAAENKGHKDKWLFNLQFPSYIPLMTYAKSRDLREKMWRAYTSRSFNSEFDNQENIKKILSLRYERAQILGFKNHADFVLADRMAQNTQTVMSFLDKLISASKTAALKDLGELKEFAKSTDGISDLKPWDTGYYSEKLKEKKFSFNEEDLRPYFKLENVIDGIFKHAKLLYGLVFKENKDIPLYHPEMTAYEIYEESTKKYMGLFYVDYFPRETKKSGAWMTQYRPQGLFKGKVRRPHISNVCNFTKSTPTKPSLLTYDEVRTLFHEFGHALHGILSECEYPSMSGTNTLWDFVELPSQIMENWTAHKDGLDLFAKHYKTNEPMPVELIEKVKAAQKFQAGMFSIRQLNFGILDMKWHLQDPKNILDVAQFEIDATAETRIMPVIPGANSSCSFSHIFAGGYSAGYYSYKWAEVLDADAFEYFLEKGLFNQEVATSFKKNILSKGDTEHPMELYKKFRGREPDPNALLRRDGLI